MVGWLVLDDKAGEGCGGMRTSKLGLEPLAHEAKFDLVEGLEDVGGHDCFLVGCYRGLVCAVARWLGQGIWT